MRIGLVAIGGALAALFLSIATDARADAPMPTKIGVIVCKTVEAPFASELDAYNARWTGHESRKWDTAGNMMHCRRFEERVEHSSDPKEKFTPQKCQRSALMTGIAWDMAHRSSPYRFWRVMCPVPIIDTKTGAVIAWKVPECGHRDTVICEIDTAI